MEEGEIPLPGGEGVHYAHHAGDGGRETRDAEALTAGGQRFPSSANRSLLEGRLAGSCFLVKFADIESIERQFAELAAACENLEQDIAALLADPAKAARHRTKAREKANSGAE